MEENKLAIFEGKRIRKTIHNNEWWFSIIDVIKVLTDSSIPKRYWSDLKRKLVNEGFSEIVHLKMAAPDGKMRLTDCIAGKVIVHRWNEVMAVREIG